MFYTFDVEHFAEDTIIIVVILKTVFVFLDVYTFPVSKNRENALDNTVLKFLYSIDTLTLDRRICKFST